MTDYLLLIIVGAAGGFLSGMLGVGGGVIFVPVIDHLLQRAGIQGELLVSMILANSLATITFTGTISSIKQYRIGNFYPRQIMITAIPGVISSLGLSYFITHSDFYSKARFNIFFASILLFLLIRMLWQGKQSDEKPRNVDEVPASQYALTGFATGFVTALSGLGGGIVMIPIFSNFMKINIKVATSISTGVLTVLVFPVTLQYLLSKPSVQPELGLQLGYVVFSIILPLALGTFFMAPLGVKASQKTPAAKIRLIFSIFVMLVLSRVLLEIFGIKF